MTVYVFRLGGIVEKGSAPPRSGLAVISDVMPPAKHMSTGVVTDSKSHFRAMTKRAGLVEVGNDPAARREGSKPDFTAGIERDVQRAIQEVNSR